MPELNWTVILDASFWGIVYVLASVFSMGVLIVIWLISNLGVDFAYKYNQADLNDIVYSNRFIIIIVYTILSAVYFYIGYMIGHRVSVNPVTHAFVVALLMQVVLKLISIYVKIEQDVPKSKHKNFFKNVALARNIITLFAALAGATVASYM